MPKGTEPPTSGESTDVDAVRSALRRERTNLAQARQALDRERAELAKQRAQLDARRAGREAHDGRAASDPLEESWVVQGAGSFLSWAQDDEDDDGLPRPRGGRDAPALDRLVEALSDRVAVRLEARVAQAVHEALLREREALREQREQLTRSASALERQRQQLEERWHTLRQVEGSRSLTETKLDLTPIELPPPQAPQCPKEAPRKPPSERMKRPQPPA